MHLIDGTHDAQLFRTFATLRLDAPVFDTVDDLRWMGPRASFDAQCETMGSPDLWGRVMSAVTSSEVAPDAPALRRMID